METLRAKGDTIILWDKDIDCYVTILPATSFSVLPLLLDSPGLSPSIHIGIYLPTRGLHRARMGHISVSSIYDCGGCSIITSRGPNIYQGDTNVNPNHPTRPQLLQEFLERYNLLPTPLGHTTYHHFMGNGASHSQLDILIYSSGHSDKLVDIICKVDNPLVTSSHDVIVSSFELSPVFHQPQATPKAPRAPKPRFRVV